MLSAKSWKPDAVLRLLLSVFICIYAGSLALCTARYFQAGAKSGRWFFLLVAAAFVCLGTDLVLIRKPWRLQNIFRQAVALLGLFYAGMFLGAWAEKLANLKVVETASVGQLLVTALSFQGATLVLMFFFLREHQTTWTQAFGVRYRPVQAILLGLVVACVFLPVGSLLQQVSARLMEHLPFFQLKPEEQMPVQTLRLAVRWGDRVMLGLVTIALAPAVEEMLFRGVLYPWVKQSGFPRLALWGTALAFATMHLNLVTFLPLLLLALALTLLYEHTNNLLAPVAAHTLFNGLNFAQLYLSGRGFLVLLSALVIAVLSGIGWLALRQTLARHERI